MSQRGVFPLPFPLYLFPYFVSVPLHETPHLPLTSFLSNIHSSLPLKRGNLGKGLEEKHRVIQEQDQKYCISLWKKNESSRNSSVLSFFLSPRMQRSFSTCFLLLCWGENNQVRAREELRYVWYYTTWNRIRKLAFSVWSTNHIEQLQMALP